jgi:hypothetical protein
MFNTCESVRLAGRKGEASTDFGDSALHDEEMGIVDVKLDRLEEGLDDVLLGFVAIEEVLGYVGQRDLGIARMSIHEQ